jgi:hypothetical protein
VLGGYLGMTVLYFFVGLLPFRTIPVAGPSGRHVAPTDAQQVFIRMPVRSTTANHKVYYIKSKHEDEAVKEALSV